MEPNCSTYDNCYWHTIAMFSAICIAIPLQSIAKTVVCDAHVVNRTMPSDSTVTAILVDSRTEFNEQFTLLVS